MSTTPSLNLLGSPPADTGTEGAPEQPTSPATPPPAHPMTTDEIRAYILSRPDTPATTLANELRLKPIQVAGYRAASTLKRHGGRRRPSRWTHPPLPRKLASQVLANRRRVASLQRQLKTAIARLRIIDRCLTSLSARGKR